MFKKLILLLGVLPLIVPIASRAETDPGVSLGKRAETLLMAHRFAELDAVADKLRASDARFPGGHSQLSYIYTNLGAFAGDGCGCADDISTVRFADKKKAIETWLAQRPQSMAGQIAMTQFLYNNAWVARGHGYVSETTKGQWLGYRLYLSKARAVLARLDPKRDPYIYLMSMQIAVGEPDARAHLDALFKAGVHSFPKYFTYYADRADDLQEKWFGEPGELAAFTRSLLKSPGGDDGLIAYSYVAGRFVRNNIDTPGLIYRDTGLDWPLVKKAYAARERRSGLGASEWNTLLFLALIANDPASGAAVVKHIGPNWSKSIWHDASGYAATVKWSQFTRAY